ncbi:rRNA maturation RNase YbeY [Treponema phagedenis]|uniref:rRNA maturation RNase YbeY n=1 Tax=Treponema phagedenis TaxID=162 RepID=UPI0001F63948|nr:rRNA maturation RNase YbeY [Treponema phagedenis]EFW36449.1 translation metalloprotein YbeY [Treponema phagedenis F0421]TYT79097.1 rRNA maturation RNase YbeY [Treponema phagedenis]
MPNENRVFISTENLIDDPLWLPKVESFLLKVLERMEIQNWDLSVVFCNDEFIHTLNKTYRHIDSPTDVLSFENGEKYFNEDGEARILAGDIIISLDSVKANAYAFHVSIDEELRRLLIHGVLHLFGMDHTDNSPEQEMLQLQEKILAETAEELYRE